MNFSFVIHVPSERQGEQVRAVGDQGSNQGGNSGNDDNSEGPNQAANLNQPEPLEDLASWPSKYEFQLFFFLISSKNKIEYFSFNS